MSVVKQDEVPSLTLASFFCTLNFILSILGYGLVMSLLLPVSGNLDQGENVYFTYPYRAVQLLVAVIAFLLVRSRPAPRFNFQLGLLVVFWVLYLCRAFWDLFVSQPTGTILQPGNEFYFACYVAIDFLPLLAIFKGSDLINFPRALRWILIFGLVGLVFSLSSTQSAQEASWTEDLGRFAASRMLHTQALGTFGCSLAIVALWSFLHLKIDKIAWKILSILVLALGVFIMLKSGSRGPVFGFAIVVCCFFGARSRNLLLGMFLFVFFSGIFVIFQDQILELIEQISPVMSNRLNATLEGGDTSGRDVLWKEYWYRCLENPIVGFRLERLGYPHNMFLDGLMMFGMVAGWIVTILILLGGLSAIKVLRGGLANSWWVLLLLRNLTQAFTQSGFSDISIQAPLVLLFIGLARQKKQFRRVVFFKPKEPQGRADICKG